MSTVSPYPSASLYVGDLVPDVTEGLLFEVFNQVGPVASIRVCRDAITRRSLGYAYINFHTFMDAERALDALNNTPIQGRPCRIMWSQRDPAIRRAGVGNVFIKNLDPDIGHKELHDTFSAFGNILSCKVALGENNQSRGFGFVHFENEESALRAINKANGKIMGTKKVYVGNFIPKRERLKTNESMWTNVYVKNIDKEWTDKELSETFSKWGEITSAIVMTDENGSRGFGFVNFAKHDDAVRAVRELESEAIKNKDDITLFACRAQKKSERINELARRFEQLKIERITKYQGINLYIKNIEDEISEDRLRFEFSPFGNIQSVKIMTDDKRNSKGFGFVCFSTPEEAQLAITEMNGRTLSGCSKPLYVTLHEPKEIRRQKLATQYASRLKGIRQQSMPPPGALYRHNGPIYFGGGALPPNFVYNPNPPVVSRPRWPNSSGQNNYSGQAPVVSNFNVSNVVGHRQPRNSSRGTNVSQNAASNQQPVAPIQQAKRQNTRQPEKRFNVEPRTQQPVGVSEPVAREPEDDATRSNPTDESSQVSENQAPQAQSISQQPSQQQIPDDSSLTLKKLTGLKPEQQKLVIGEKLYPLVFKKENRLAGKITGMLLEGTEVVDLLKLLSNDDVLSEKVQQALNTLNSASKK